MVQYKIEFCFLEGILNMRKIRVLSFILALFICLPLFAACTQKVKEPKGHNMGAWTVEKEPTYKKKGTLVRFCTDEGCDYKQTYKTKSSKVTYLETEDGKIYVSGKKSSKTTFLYIDSKTPDGKTVSGIAEFAFFDDKKLSYAYVEDGISDICSYAFAGCEVLAEVHLPKNCELIDFCHFMACYSLKRVNLPENMTSLPDQIFDGCESLTTIQLPSGIKSIGYSAFNMCSALSSIVLPEGVTEIGADAFSGCTALLEIVIPQSVKSIRENAFIGCSALKEIVLPRGLEVLRESAFSYCIGLEKVYIPGSVAIINANTGFSPFNFCNKNLVLITDANERPAGWSEQFNVYYVGESKTEDPADGYLYLQVIYGGEIPET